MGFGSILKKVSGAMRATTGAFRAQSGAALAIPGVRAAAKKIPVIGAALTAGSILTDMSSRFGGSGGSLQAGGFAGGLPALPGTAGAPDIIGDRGLFQNDPNIAAALQPWAISKTHLRIQYRSPIKGFVVVRDSAGDPYALPRMLARKYAGWKPSKKPPISVGEHQALLRADRTVKKVRKIMAMVSRVDKNVGKGGKVVIKKKGGK